MRTITLFILALLLLPASLSAQQRGTWRKSLVCTHCKPIDMAFADINSGFIVISPSDLSRNESFTTRDGGLSFVKSDSVLVVVSGGSRPASCPAPDYWVYLAEYGYTAYSTDFGKDWPYRLGVVYDAFGNLIPPESIWYIKPISMPSPDRSIQIVTLLVNGHYSDWFAFSFDQDSTFHLLSDTLIGHAQWGYASPDLSVLFAGVGQLARSTDSGAHWKYLHPVDTNVPLTSYGSITPGYGAGHFFLSGGRIDTAAGKDIWLDDYLESTDTGSTWREVSNVAGGRVYDIANPDSNILWATVKHLPLIYDHTLPYNSQPRNYADSLFYSSDGGSTWIKNGNTFKGDAIRAMRWITANNGYVITYRDSSTFLYHYSIPDTSGVRDTAMTVTPLSWNFGSTPIGHTDTATFTISNASSPGVSISGTVSYPTDATFYVPFGTGAFTLSEGATKKLMVLYTPPDSKARSATMTVTGPRPTDHVTINLSAGASNGVISLQEVETALVMFPNPAESTIAVGSLNKGIVVFDALGRSRECPISGNNLDISRLPAGVYYVSDGTRRARFVKE